jgi:hypothetical protein
MTLASLQVPTVADADQRRGIGGGTSRYPRPRRSPHRDQRGFGLRARLRWWRPGRHPDLGAACAPEARGQGIRPKDLGLPRCFGPLDREGGHAKLRARKGQPARSAVPAGLPALVRGFAPVGYAAAAG